jgi:AcrR family transcriptional regulator
MVRQLTPNQRTPRPPHALSRIERDLRRSGLDQRKNRTTTRQRLVNAGVKLFKRQGLHATGVKEILQEAGAQSSSMYHFFPGGKEELAGAVIAQAGADYRQLVEDVWDAEDDAVSGVREIFEAAADVLEASDYADICPIGTVAHEVAGTNNELRSATAEVFETWIDSACRRLVDAGATVDDAATLAPTLVALLEGSFILCRTLRSVEPMRDAARVAAYVVRPVLARNKKSYLRAEARTQAPHRR